MRSGTRSTRAPASARRRHGKLRGRGIATFLEWTGAEVFEEQVTVTVADGAIEIFSATQPMGTSLTTTFTQLAVDVFGVPPDKIRFAYGDTDRGTGFGSAGSRSLFVGGSAVHVASERTVKKAHELAAEELEAAPGDIEYRDGVFRIARDRSRDRPLRSRARSRPTSASCWSRRARSPKRRGRTAATCARSRSTRRRARSRSTITGR